MLDTCSWPGMGLPGMEWRVLFMEDACVAEAQAAAAQVAVLQPRGPVAAERGQMSIKESAFVSVQFVCPEFCGSARVGNVANAPAAAALQ